MFAITVYLAVILTSTAFPETAPQRGRSVSRPDDGRIAGRITDASGQSVANVFVSVLQEYERDTRGAPPLHPPNVGLFSITNEHGEFLLEHVRPGGYCVVAIPRNSSVPATQSTRSGYAITYYPGTATAANARSVTVAPRGSVTANITMAPARLHTIAGSVTGSNGQAASNARLLVAIGDGLFGLNGWATSTRADGTFAVTGLPPATYFLHFREGVWPPPRDVIPKVSVAKVVVVDRDVTDVRVVPLPMVRVTGRVIVDPADRPLLRPSAITVFARPIDINGNPGPTRAGTLRDDLTFEFRTWPALGTVEIGRQSEWFIRTVRLNGTDVTTKGIDFRAGRDLTGLEVELFRGPR